MQGKDHLSLLRGSVAACGRAVTRNLVPAYELVVSSASGTISFVVLNPESRTSGNISRELLHVDAQQSGRTLRGFPFLCSRGTGSWKQSTEVPEIDSLNLFPRVVPFRTGFSSLDRPFVRRRSRPFLGPRTGSDKEAGTKIVSEEEFL